jgi:hypothetical protein
VAGLLWPGPVVAVTVRQALRQWQRKHTSVPVAESAAGGAPARRRSAMVDRASRAQGMTRLGQACLMSSSP